MQDEAEESRGRQPGERLKRALLIIFVLAPVALFLLAVVGVNLFLLGSEVVKLLTW